MASVVPIIEEIIDNADGTYTVHFGYESDYSSTQTIAISAVNNGFSPVPIDRGQPTSFSVGRQRNIFSVTWDGTNLSWTLDGTTVTADESQSLLPVEGTKTITAEGVSYYTAGIMTALSWIKKPNAESCDRLIILAVSDPYGNVINVDSSIKLELLKVGSDYRLVYFSSRSKLINKTLGININDGNWHFVSYECLPTGIMRYSIDGIEIPAETGTDINGNLYSKAYSTKLRVGGGFTWSPYLYKEGQSLYLYQVRFGTGFNLGLSWITQLMEIDKIELGIS